MGYRFSLVLSREVNDDESALLKEAGCSAAVFGIDSLPTNADVTVTKMDFDDTAAPGLAEAIESALEAVKTVPDLTVPGLTVPAQPAGPSAQEPKVVAGEVVEDGSAEVEPEVTEEPAAVKKATPARTRTRKTTTRKKIEVSAEAE